VAATVVMRSEPTVFVVDDEPAMREFLRWLVESVGLPVETFSTAREFLDACDPERPGCLVLDARMPGMSGFDLQEELAARKISIPIIIITAYAEVPMAVRALKTGAFDFIEKPFSHQVLLDRIQQAIESDQVARRVQMQQAAVRSRLARLTPRQRQVLDRMIAGKPSKIIAAELGLSPKTVDVHRARVMRTMQAASLADLLRLTLMSPKLPPAEPTPAKALSLKSTAPKPVHVKGHAPKHAPAKRPRPAR
jgi:two-component system response regulator FixJ